MFGERASKGELCNKVCMYVYCIVEFVGSIQFPSKYTFSEKYLNGNDNKIKKLSHIEITLKINSDVMITSTIFKKETGSIKHLGTAIESSKCIPFT